MPAPLSIVVPTLNAASDLPELLLQCEHARSIGLCAQIIISDGGSTDETVEQGMQIGAEILSGSPGRGGQLRRGAAQVKTPWMLTLHADSQLGDGWEDAVAEHIERFPSRAGYFQLRFRKDGLAARIVARGANLRSRILHLPYGDQGLLVPMSLYHNIGGYPDQPLMEDVEIARRLSGKLKQIPADILTSAKRYETHGWVRQSGANLLRLARYKFGDSPEKLAAGYKKR